MFLSGGKKHKGHRVNPLVGERCGFAALALPGWGSEHQLLEEGEVSGGGGGRGLGLRGWDWPRWEGPAVCSERCGSVPWGCFVDSFLTKLAEHLPIWGFGRHFGLSLTILYACAGIVWHLVVCCLRVCLFVHSFACFLLLLLLLVLIMHQQPACTFMTNTYTL